MANVYDIPGFTIVETGEYVYDLPGVVVCETADSPDPLTLADDTFTVTAPYEADDPVGTVAATGGTAPITYTILSQTRIT